MSGKERKSFAVPAKLTGESGETVNDAERIASPLLNAMLASSLVEPPKLNPEQSELLRSAKRNAPHAMNSSIKSQEVEEALRSLKNTAPGPDQTTNSMLKNLSQTNVESLTKPFNLSLCENALLQQWREAEVIPLLKGGKDPKNPTLYRPIALTSSICKLMEKVVTARLKWFLEKERGYLNPRRVPEPKGNNHC